MVDISAQCRATVSAARLEAQLLAQTTQSKMETNSRFERHNRLGTLLPLISPLGSHDHPAWAGRNEGLSGINADSGYQDNEDQILVSSKQ
jgi:hypothetical protein